LQPCSLPHASPHLPRQCKGRSRRLFSDLSRPQRFTTRGGMQLGFMLRYDQCVGNSAHQVRNVPRLQAVFLLYLRSTQLSARATTERGHTCGVWVGLVRSFCPLCPTIRWQTAINRPPAGNSVTVTGCVGRLGILSSAVAQFGRKALTWQRTTSFGDTTTSPQFALHPADLNSTNITFC